MVRQGYNESMLPLVAGSIEIVQIHNVVSKTITYDIVMLRLLTVAWKSEPKNKYLLNQIWHGCVTSSKESIILIVISEQISACCIW